MSHHDDPEPRANCVGGHINLPTRMMDAVYMGDHIAYRCKRCLYEDDLAAREERKDHPG